MISFYKWKRYAIFSLLGTLPTMIFIMVFFPSIKIIIVDPINIVISLAASMLVAAIIIIIGNKMLRHAFTNMIEGKGLLAFILDSTGIMACFNVLVNAPAMKGIFNRKGVADVEDTYNVDLMHRLIVPRDATLTKAVTFDRDETGKIVLGESVDVLVLPHGDSKYDNLFAFENKPAFIYNKVLGKFLSRDALAKFEKDIMLKHNALNILRKVQEIDINFRNFGRYAGELLHPKKGFLSNNPIIKYIIIAAIVGLIIMVILMFLPGLIQSGAKIMPPSTTIP